MTIGDTQRQTLAHVNYRSVGGAGHFPMILMPSPSITEDGAFHLFVNPATGDDNNDGLSATETPLRTLQALCDRISSYVEVGADVDIVGEIANGTYAEDVQLNLARPPKRRVILRGDIATMTVVASGTCGAGTGSGNAVVDDTANFGTGIEVVGLLLHQFDPANRAATERWWTIASQTNTSLRTLQAGANGPGGAPAAGWSYEILRPAAIITGNAAGPVRTPSFTAVLPWGASRNRATETPGPKLVMAWLQIDNADTAVQSAQIFGGDVRMAGVVMEGTNGGLYLRDSVISGGVGNTTDADPVFDLPASSTALSHARYAMMPTAAAKVGLTLDRSFMNFGPVCTALGGILATDQSRLSLSVGAAIYNGQTVVEESSSMDMFSANAEVQVLFKGQGVALTSAILLRQLSTARQVSASNGPTIFDSVACPAVRLESGSCWQVDGRVKVANLTARFIDCQTTSFVNFAESTGAALNSFHQALTVPSDPATEYVNLDEAEDLASLMALLNQEKAVINVHMATFGAGLLHIAASAASITAADATDLATSITLVNEIKARVNTHRTEAGVHVNNDTLNTIALADATDLRTAISLANEIRIQFDTHALDGREIRVDGPGATQGLATGTISGLGAGAATARVPIISVTPNTGARVYRRAA